MDKSKSRNDLLAAGRKKLQQYRQKKGNIGNDSKSKDTKHGHDTAGETATDGACLPADGEVMAEAGVPETVSSEQDSESKLELSVVEKTVLSEVTDEENACNSMIPLEVGDSSVALFDDGRDSMLDTSGSFLIKEKSSEFEATLADDLSRELNMDHGAEQVTDVEATLKAGVASRERINELEEPQNEEDNSRSLSDLTETVGDKGTTFLEKTPEVKVSAQVHQQPARTFDSLLNSSATEDAEADDVIRHESSVPESGIEPAVTSGVSDQHIGDVQFDSSTELKKEVHNVCNDHDHFNVLRASYLEPDDTMQYLASKQVDLSSALDGNLIKLSQLANVFQTLGEDEISFLLMSRGLSLISIGEAEKQEVYDVLESLKKELCVTSFSKNALYLQLSESEKFIDEISEVNESLIKLQETNTRLSEDIVRCNQELERVLLDRKKIQVELLNSEDEVMGLVAKVNEFQNKLEFADETMCTLSSDNVNCRCLMDILQCENEELSGDLKALTEEKMDLLEERDNILLEKLKTLKELEISRASLESLNKVFADERKRFEENNDTVFRENTNLFASLEDFKAKVEALEVENKNLSEMLTSMSDERKRLDEEKESLVQNIANMSTELTNYRDFVVTLETKISNLSEETVSIREEKNKLAEDKISLYTEYEKQSRELTALRTLEGSLQSDISKAMDDLNDVTVRVSRLTDENEALNADLELHKLKLKQIVMKKDLDKFEEVAAGGPQHIIASENFITRSFQEQSEFGLYDDYSGFLQIKKNLENAEEMAQKIESEVEAMHLHFSSFRASSDKVVTPGVSRLIQAFESRSHVDEEDSEKNLSSDVQTTEDAYGRTKTMIENLRLLLKQLLYDAEIVSAFCKSKLDNLHAADATATEFKGRFDSLRDYSDMAEKENLEHIVLYEAMLEYIHFTALIREEIIRFFDFMQKQELDLMSYSSRLTEGVNHFDNSVIELQKKLDSLSIESTEMLDSVSKSLESIQDEMVDNKSKNEEEWNSFSSKVLQKVDILYATMKTSYSDVFTSGHMNLDIADYIVSSVVAANNAIDDLHRQLESAQRDLKGVSERHDRALNGMFSLLHELNDVGHRPQVHVHDNQLDLQSPDVNIFLLDKLREIFSERLNLESQYKQVIAESMSRVRELEDLDKKCFKSDIIMKLVEEIEPLVEVEMAQTDAEPASHLESLIYLLVQRCKEDGHRLSLFASTEMQLLALQGESEHLSNLVIRYEIENLIFEDRLRSAEDSLIALNFKVHEKVTELQQSEQRVSSLREKLGIAVTKGKGLILQRDNLKQSLAENSKEVEKLSVELQSKDARIHELEIKIKDYSEAGERMEALESELSYIRNSATVLRESFLLKDSLLQRIEEIMEDLELPDHFHSRDIIEKVDWLCKSVAGNASTHGDWDERGLVGAGSNNDSGFVGADNIKEYINPNNDSVDELRIRSEELQNKLYALSEQNEMLEQLLTERNNLVHSWEEILDRADMPSQLQSVEPENKLQFLVNALAEAQSSCVSLQQKFENLETLCVSLTADADDSKGKASELQLAFQKACLEKEVMARDLEILNHDNTVNLKKVGDLNTEIDNLENEVTLLREQKIQIESNIQSANDAIRRLQELNADLEVSNESIQNEVLKQQQQKLAMEEKVHHNEDMIRRLHLLVCDALQDSNDIDHLGQDAVKCLEENLNKLIQKYNDVCSITSVNADPVISIIPRTGEISHDNEVFPENWDSLKKDLEGELMRLKEENNSYILRNQSLIGQVEELETEKRELQGLFNEEEQKSASFREKLNIAVRKGKSLVQQRDSMKQVIEQLNVEVEQLKSENEQIKDSISKHEEQAQSISTIQERVQVIEHENSSLKDRLRATEHLLLEKEGSWNILVSTLDSIGAGFSQHTQNPIDKLKDIGEYIVNLNKNLDSLEQESRKSRRAAELLLAELNEVQERNDALQEELVNAHHELTMLSNEKDFAAKEKIEALAHIDKLSYMHSEEKEKQLSEITMLKSGIENTREDFSVITNEILDIFSRNLVVLQSVKSTMISLLGLEDSPDIPPVFPPSNAISWKSEIEVISTELAALWKELYNQSHLLQEETSVLSKLVMGVHRKCTSQNNLFESIKADLKKFKLIAQEKESELDSLQGNVSLLYETIATAISEIESWRDHMDGNVLSSDISERKSELQIPVLGDGLAVDSLGVRDRLLLGIRDLIGKHGDLLEVGQREMKDRIQDLQKELHEKDIQRDRICMEFVDQIREAESNAKNYLHELQEVRLQLHDSHKQMEAKDEECSSLKKKIKELEDKETNSSSLQQEISSLRDTLASKVQEIDELMQAVDEQEAELEGLTKKIEGLQNELEQKSKELENVESSRTKTVKKLSVTVSKFDELHFLSESLLSEVERLQSQLQERDEKISFLRREVTRCTDDALSVTKMSKKNTSDEIYELLTWFDYLLSHAEGRDIADDILKNEATEDHKEVLKRKISELLSEVENLRVEARKSEALLHEERNKVEELSRKEENLKSSLFEKQSQLMMLQDTGNSVRSSVSPLEIVEVEQTKNNWTSPGTITPQVRSLRKANNDQVAIAIDADPGSDRLQDDDDKAHGFKSLTASKFVPQFTRPVSDIVDGVWVTCDRALMRRPALRLLVMFYWVVLHALLATYAI